MSSWHLWHAFDCMKYFAGMYPPSFVCAELGKNFPCGPSPSPSMDAAAVCGLLMRFVFRHNISRVHHVPAAIATVSKHNSANRATRCPGLEPSHPREASHEAAKNKTPATQKIMCAYNHGFSRFGVPTKISAIPSTVPV